MKAFSNSLLAMLVVAALFWGNCFSCPQLLLSLAKKDAHSCCKRSAPVSQKCTTNVLKHFIKADPVKVAAPAAMPIEQVVFAPAAAVIEVTTVPAQYSPPDLFQLTSLRI